MKYFKISSKISSHYLKYLFILFISIAVIIIFNIIRVEEVYSKVYESEEQFRVDAIKRSVNEGNCEVILSPRNRNLVENNSSLLFYQGLCLYKLQKVEEALEAFEAVLKLEPDHTDALNNKANIYFQYLHQKEEALTIYNKIITKEPLNINFRLNRVLVLEDLKNYEKALDDLMFITKIDPRNSIAWLLKSNIYKNLGDYKQAIFCINRAILYNPDFIEAYTNRGILRIEMGNKRLGCNDLVRAMQAGSQLALEQHYLLCNK